MEVPQAGFDAEEGESDGFGTVECVHAVVEEHCPLDGEVDGSPGAELQLVWVVEEQTHSNSVHHHRVHREHDIALVDHSGLLVVAPGPPINVIHGVHDIPGEVDEDVVAAHAQGAII